jgi:hypothetical protein
VRFIRRATVPALVASVAIVAFSGVPRVEAQVLGDAPSERRAYEADCVAEAELLPSETDINDLAVHRCACAEGRAQSCAAVADVAWSTSAKREYDGRACDRGILSSCIRAGKLAEEEGRTDEAQALEEHACNSGSGKGCSLLARLLDLDRYGSPRDPAASSQLLVRACDLQSCEDCSRAAKRLRGHGVAADEQKATDLFLRGCKGCAIGCVDAAERLRDGVGAEPDAARALEAFRGSCPDATALPAGPLKPCHPERFPQLREGATVINSRLSPMLLDRLTDAQLPLLKACWAGWPSERRHAHATLRFVIDRAGSAQFVELGHAENIEPEMEACIRRALPRFVYPGPAGGMITMTYPIVFDYGG